MYITNMQVENFKSFDSISVSLQNMNVIIGANSSGKSNFVQVFAFLRDIERSGLDDAISLQGGAEYLTNASIGSTRPLRLSVTQSLSIPEENVSDTHDLQYTESTYVLAIVFDESSTGYRIDQDRQHIRFNMRERVQGKRGKKRASSGEFIINNREGKVEISIANSLELPIDTKKLSYLPYRLYTELSSTDLFSMPPEWTLLTNPILRLPWFPSFGDISIYDLDPKLAKRAARITGRAQLEEDGCNIAIVLKKILSNEDNRKRFILLIRDLLPFIKGVDVESIADKSVIFKIQEQYLHGKYFPSSLLSDGTISIAALIIALFFEDNKFVIFEEPERNIHPHLMSRLMNIMGDSSRKKQIVITTHNPEVLRNVDSKNILLATRNPEGFSVISRPFERSDIKLFLEEEIGIDELFVHDVLGMDQEALVRS
jgi:predicted ATPase